MKKGSTEWYVEMTENINDNIAHAFDISNEIKRGLKSRAALRFARLIKRLVALGKNPIKIISEMRGIDFEIPENMKLNSQHNNDVVDAFAYSVLAVPKKYFGSD